MMVIEKTSSEIIIRISKNVNIDTVQRALDYLLYQDATADSEATENDIENLVKEVKSSRWEKRRKFFTNAEKVENAVAL